MSSIDSSFSLLKLFTHKRLSLGVAEAANLSGLPKSSVSRLFKTLEKHRFVIQDGPRGAYSVGPELRRIGNLYVGGKALSERMDEFLRAQVAKTGATGYLTRLVGDQLEILEVVQGSYPIRLVHEVGTMERLDSTSAGLAMILRLPEEERADILSHSPLGAALLQPILDEAEELLTVLISSVAYKGFSAVAVAVHDEQKNVTYGLSLSFPDSLLSAGDVARVRGEFVAVLPDLAQISDDKFLLSRLSKTAPSNDAPEKTK